MEPKMVENRPVILNHEPGTYYWCACGLSGNQPFCDGAHAGTGIAPTRYAIEETRQAAICQCKRTKNPPFCDGSHAHL